MDRCRLLGRSGLRVSPLALGTMTFGPDWGWGAHRDEAQRIFDSYVERGGNFIDTANVYTNGTAEELIGEFSTGRRHRLVIATKFCLPTGADANSGGSHRKSMIRSVEASLRRLKTDYIDVLYLHAWDATTPPAEVVRAMESLVQCGKVLYLGVSNTPAWQVARMEAIAELRGWSQFAALQVQYNLVERSAERELLPMAADLGISVVAWSPLAGGILSGKYAVGGDARGRPLGEDAARRGLLEELGSLSERALHIAEAAKAVAHEIGCAPAQVALAWVLSNPAITAPVIGARTLKQLEQNLGALDIRLTADQRARLSKAANFELGYPHDYLTWLLGSSFMASCMNIEAPR